MKRKLSEKELEKVVGGSNFNCPKSINKMTTNCLNCGLIEKISSNEYKCPVLNKLLKIEPASMSSAPTLPANTLGPKSYESLPDPYDEQILSINPSNKK